MAIYDDLTLMTLLKDKKKQFIIPFYQRSYNWTPENVERLIDDLILFRRSLDEPGANMNSKYFVGNIVTKELKQSTGTLLKKFVVVDGQQRITTTLLIVLAIYKIDKDNFDDLLDCIEVRSNDSEIRLKIDRMNDGQVLTKILKGKSLTIEEKATNLYTNYFHAKKFIEDKGIINDLYDALDRTLLFNVILDEQENEKKVFETINSTGLKLSQADLIKNFIFFDSHLFSEEQENELENIYRDIESIVDTDRLSEILRFFIAIHSTDKDLPSKRGNAIFSSFRKMISKNAIDLTSNDQVYKLLSSIKNLVNYLEIFEKDNKSWNMAEKFYLQTVKGSINTYTTIFAELMSYFNNDMSNKETTISILRILSKLIIFRGIADMPEKNITRDVPKMFSHFKDYANEFKREVSLENFEEWLEKTEHNYALPTIGDMKSKAKITDYYSNAKKLQQILKAYELSLIKNGSPIDLEHKFTLEHVMPQDFTKHWFKDVEKGSGKYYEIGNKIQTLGNFTLLTKSRNTEFSNSEFLKKKRGIGKSDFEIGIPFDVLLMNKEFELINDWNFDEIDNRSELIVTSIYNWMHENK